MLLKGKRTLGRTIGLPPAALLWHALCWPLNNSTCHSQQGMLLSACLTALCYLLLLCVCMYRRPCYRWR
jgi:hypothetical protein